MQKRAGLKAGLIGGIIIALIYIVLLWIKFTFLSYNPFAFYVGNFVSYFLILGCLAILAMQKRRKQGGYAEIKDLFQPIFIAVIIAELAYFFFTYYYLNYVNPAFFAEYEKALIAFAETNKMTPEKIDAQRNMAQAQAAASKEFWPLFKAMVPRWIVVDSIFGLIIAFLLRKRTPEQLMERTMSRQQF